MGIFIGYPFLALIPALVFLVIYFAKRKTISLVTAMLWTLYTIYEYGMKFRYLCTGECNIRVDLLLIYPLLFILMLVALYRSFRAIR